MLTGLFFTYFSGPATWAYLVENRQRCPTSTNFKLLARKQDIAKYLNVKSLIGSLKAFEITAIFVDI